MGFKPLTAAHQVVKAPLGDVMTLWTATGSTRLRDRVNARSFGIRADWDRRRMRERNDPRRTAWHNHN